MSDKNNSHSLRKRYFYKLLNNLVGLPISLVIQAIIPRGLGPKLYGDFNFLNNFFTQLVGFLDIGTSDCFYTKLCHRPKESGLVSFYFYFMGIVSLVIIGFMTFIFLTPIYTKLWPGQEMLYIYLAAALGIITWIVEIFNKMNDAYGLTVNTEMAKILQKALGMILIILFFTLKQLNLKTFFFYQYIILFLLLLFFIEIINKSPYAFNKNRRLSFSQIKKYVAEFYHYTHPLFIYSLVGAIVGILDRWFLQKYSGSIQQGFFALSYQIAVISFFVTGAMTPLLMREFSIAFANKDLNQMATLFQRYIPLFYSITAYISCFIAVQADKIIHIMGGNKYSEALIPVTIMAFFPIHSTYGQLSSSVFYATGQTRLYRNIGIVFTLLGLPLTYFLIAPREQFGLDAGAGGLATKMVLFQFGIVNAYLFFNARFLRLSFWRYLGHQLLSVSSLVGIAYIVRLILDQIIGLRGIIIPGFLMAGILYTLLVMGTVYYLPIIFGLKKEDIRFLLYKFKSVFAQR